MCGARQIQILPYSDGFPPSSKMNISKTVMQFTSQVTQKQQQKTCPARASILRYLDKNTPSLRNADTFKVLCSAASQRHRTAALFRVMP